MESTRPGTCVQSVRSLRGPPGPGPRQRVSFGAPPSALCQRRGDEKKPVQRPRVSKADETRLPHLEAPEHRSVKEKTLVGSSARGGVGGQGGASGRGGEGRGRDEYVPRVLRRRSLYDGDDDGDDTRPLTRSPLHGTPTRLDWEYRGIPGTESSPLRSTSPVSVTATSSQTRRSMGRLTGDGKVGA